MRRALLAWASSLALVVAAGSVLALDAGVPSTGPLPVVAPTNSVASIAPALPSSEEASSPPQPSVPPVASLVSDAPDPGPTVSQVADLVESAAPEPGDANTGGGGSVPTTSSPAPEASGPAPSSGAKAPAPTNAKAPAAASGGPSYGGGFHKGPKQGAPKDVVGVGKDLKDRLAEVSAGKKDSAGLLGGEASEKSKSNESRLKGKDAGAQPSLSPVAVPGPGLGGVLAVLAGLAITATAARRRRPG